MEALLEGLNDAQRSAVTSPASVLQVLAPPGSGKTKTLTTRVAYLVNHERLQPWNIIVCTFTIKAAREMRERIRGFVGEGIESKLILGTFHSVARRFLSRYGQEIGIDKNFGIADTGDSTAIIKRIITRYQYAVEPSHARSRISSLKAKGISAAHHAASTKSAQNEFALVYSAYQEHLESSNLLDYDDLLMRCVELLKQHPTCVSSIQAVLIDEYQDTNNVQYELMRLMAQRTKRITIVGDPDQSIYSFRSAEIKNLHRMREDYPDSIVINLENNYRSSGCILSCALAVIEQDEARPNKALIATHCVGEQPVLRHLVTAGVEAQWIVHEITRSRTLTAGLLDYNDYAILLRSAALSLSIERALGNAGIPYRMVGGKRFFDRAEIKIVLDYLRVINHPDHNDALVRVINVPSRKIGEVTVKTLLEEAEGKKISLWKLILDFAQGKTKPQHKISLQAQKGIDIFVNLVLTSRKKLFPAEPASTEECNLFDLIGYVLQRISFEAYLKQTHKDNWQDRWENVQELVTQAAQMVTNVDDEDADALPVVEGIEQRQDTPADALSKFLANVALSTEVEKAEGEQPNQVTISTIHAAKGLEWPIVFIPAVYDGSIPHMRAEDHDEERRLLYVGMTRAQGLLYLSCPFKQSRTEETTLSKYISPRNIQKFFSSRGPSIGCSVIQDLAQILRRPCPSAADVEAARNLLERIEDDQYPATREEIDGFDPEWDQSGTGSSMGVNGGQQPPFKRRKLESSSSFSGISTAVTMQNSSNFSISKTTVHSQGGFTSARDIKSLQEEAERIRMLAAADNAAAGKEAYKESKSKEAKPSRAKPTKPRAVGQGAITSFFGRPHSTSTIDPEPLLPLPKVRTLERSQSAFVRQTHAPLSDMSNFHSSYRPAPTLPNHQLRNVPMASKPKKMQRESANGNEKYILLSSSPTKADDDVPTKFGGEGDSTIPSPTRPTTICTPTSGFRPAMTFHSTSMSQLQSQSGQPRKTLGMRRTMQGWSVKHNQMPRPQPRQS